MTNPSEPHASSHGIPARAPEPDTRDRVVEILSRHFADDRITEADLSARLDRVYHAATESELEAIIADLPALVDPAGPTRPPATIVGGQRIAALFSGLERRIPGVVPRVLWVRARLGYVELDLTHATFEPGLSTIDVRAFMGYVQIRLPAGVRVESHGRALLGYFSLKGDPGSGANERTSIVRVTGRAVFGFAECHVGRHHPDAARLHPG